MSHYPQNTHMQSLLGEEKARLQKEKEEREAADRAAQKQRVHLRQPLQVLHSHKAQILPYRIHQAHLQQDQRLQVMQDSL